VYHLVLHVDEPISIRVGRLGTFAFPAGWYVYTGSAMGGLEARIARHRRRRKTLYWHIDYLLTRARLMDVVVIPSEQRLECARNHEVLGLTGASVIAPRFGASDCRCRSHLAYLGETRPALTTRKRSAVSRVSHR
jgi:sugar fermentation stimulation protein A